jgi:hypothetical protein
VSENDSGIHGLMVELLMTEPRELDPQQFEDSIRRTLPRSRLVDGDGPGVMVAHEDFMHQYADGQTAPVLTAVMASDHHEASSIDTSQSWRFPDAAAVVDGVTERRLVVQVMGIAHPPSDRVRSFHAGLCAAIEQLRPVAVWSPHGQQLVKPDEVIENHLATVINVRMFNSDGEPGAMVMDTLGLHVLRLPDVQCHFRNLDPSGVARVLYNAATYLVDEGDVIEDGNTITGVKGSERWRCHHEMACIGPERVVLDIDVGDPHAAGQRDRKQGRRRLWSRRERERRVLSARGHTGCDRLEPVTA